MKRKLKDRSPAGLRVGGLQCLLLLCCVGGEALSVCEPLDRRAQCPLQSFSSVHDGKSNTCLASDGVSVQSRKQYRQVDLRSTNVALRIPLDSSPESLGQQHANAVEAFEAPPSSPEQEPVNNVKNLFLARESLVRQGSLEANVTRPFRIEFRLWCCSCSTLGEENGWSNVPGHVIEFSDENIGWTLPNQFLDEDNDERINTAIPRITHDELIAQTNDDGRAVKIIVLLAIGLWFIVFGVLS